MSCLVIGQNPARDGPVDTGWIRNSTLVLAALPSFGLIASMAQRERKPPAAASIPVAFPPSVDPVLESLRHLLQHASDPSARSSRPIIGWEPVDPLTWGKSILVRLKRFEGTFVRAVEVVHPLPLRLSLASLSEKKKKKAAEAVKRQAKVFRSAARALKEIQRELSRSLPDFYYDDGSYWDPPIDHALKLVGAAAYAVAKSVIPARRRGAPKKPYSLWVPMMEHLVSNGFTTGDLADLILASNEDWRAPPCPDFVARYTDHDKRDGPGSGRQKLIKRLDRLWIESGLPPRRT
jgi:hypothetical protein